LRKKNSKSLFGFLFFFGVLIGGALYLYNSLLFEREAPVITLQSNGFWNFKEPLKINISDIGGIKSYKVILTSKDDDRPLKYEHFIDP